MLYFRTILERDVDIPKEKVTNYLLQVLAIKEKCNKKKSNYF